MNLVATRTTLAAGVRLESARLVLRELELSDWPAVHAYSSEPGVTRYQPWGPNTPAGSRTFVRRVVAGRRREPRRDHHLAVTLAESGQLVGTAALIVRSSEHGQGEIGYFLAPASWGHGYATEAAQLLLDFGFGRLGLHRIFATVDPRNEASIRVLTKLGMRLEGRLRETMHLRDGWRDSLLLAMLVLEWQRRQPPA